MGVVTAPVAGSGSCPAWIAFVSKSIAPIVGVLPAQPGPEVGRPGAGDALADTDLVRVEPVGKAAKACGDVRAGTGRRFGLRPHALDVQHSHLPVVHRLDPSDLPVTEQDRQ